MIKVLVVDDDKLVRKGLISVMPWQDFEMEVVGEASNGSKALEFLAAHEVDLLLTDLEMPVMSGMELMHLVREQHPDVYIAVLTLHQDFEYIQEAIRLGAIDYIAKVQLEKERFEEVLGRIHRRITEQEGRIRKLSMLPGASSPDESFTTDRGYILLPAGRGTEPGEVVEWPVRHAERFAELRHQVLFFTFGEREKGEERLDELVRLVSADSDWTLIRLTGIQGRMPAEVHDWVRKYSDGEFFYEYDPAVNVIDKNLSAPESGATSVTDETVLAVMAQWLSPGWIYRDGLFQTYLQELKDLRLPQAELSGRLYVLADRWDQLAGKTGTSRIRLHTPLDSWFQVKGWFDAVRKQLREEWGRAPFSPEVIQSVMTAVSMLHEELDQPLTAAEIARRVSMSRSYFSQCFKEIVGTNFNAYLRRIRLDQAKHYLGNTTKTVLWIAQHVGYEDEKYFSRSFREYTGLLPSEYRNQSDEGREMSSGK
ncbi:response regulator [Paenibacillus sp. XY044]|uniref:response regulator transcription factor n=1 Tax=Paenibacillus sp. XY044 TaxID=2026089 RepID=UPI0015C5C490|nr:response regulator [Paenibacillus sp. XY044]